MMSKYHPRNEAVTHSRWILKKSTDSRSYFRILEVCINMPWQPRSDALVHHYSLFFLSSCVFFLLFFFILFFSFSFFLVVVVPTAPLHAMYKTFLFLSMFRLLLLLLLLLLLALVLAWMFLFSCLFVCFFICLFVFLSFYLHLFSLFFFFRFHFRSRLAMPLSQHGFLKEQHQAINLVSNCQVHQRIRTQK